MARSVTGDFSVEVLRAVVGQMEIPPQMKAWSIMTFPDRSAWKNICRNPEDGKRGRFRNPPNRQLYYIIIRYKLK